MPEEDRKEMNGMVPVLVLLDGRQGVSRWVSSIRLWNKYFDLDFHTAITNVLVSNVGSLLSAVNRCQLRSPTVKMLPPVAITS